jgi:hypothetical protein
LTCGSKIEVYWSEEDTFYECAVSNIQDNLYTFDYNDGDSEIHQRRGGSLFLSEWIGKHGKSDNTGSNVETVWRFLEVSVVHLLQFLCIQSTYKSSIQESEDVSGPEPSTNDDPDFQSSDADNNDDPDFRPSDAQDDHSQPSGSSNNANGLITKTLNFNHVIGLDSNAYYSVFVRATKEDFEKMLKWRQTYSKEKNWLTRMEIKEKLKSLGVSKISMTY